MKSPDGKNKKKVIELDQFKIQICCLYLPLCLIPFTLKTRKYTVISDVCPPGIKLSHISKIR